MWIQFEISDIKYFLLCQIDETAFECVLYDGQSSWYETQSIDTILKRTKELNKRIQFDEPTIKETLQTAQPTEASWLESDECSLKLKYSLDSVPFHFKWHFIKQTEHEFQRFILFPLFKIVRGLSEQNEELLEIVKKKDVELKQYKIEGATLKRVTVATPPFDLTKFNAKFADTTILLKSLNQISDLLKEQYSQLKTPIKDNLDKSEENNGKKDETQNLKLTPRKKRRKVLEEQHRVIAEKIKARGKPLEYESSQASTASENEIAIKAENNEKSTRLRAQSAAKVPLPPKKPKVASGVEYEDNESSSDERNSAKTSKESSLEKGQIETKSPIKSLPSPSKASTSKEVKNFEQSSTNTLASTTEVLSDDVKNIIDEWKALEQRRVSDMNTRDKRPKTRLS